MFFLRSTRLHAALDCIRLRPLSVSLRDLLYSTPNYFCSSSHFQISLHIPYPPLFTFLTLTFRDCEWKDDVHHASISNAELEFHLFAVAPQTFITAVLEGFRIRVFRSEFTPFWIETIRRNIIGIILNGLYLRLDHLRTKVIFDSVPLKDDSVDYDKNSDESSYSEKSEDDSQPPDDREAVVSFSASEWHMKDLWSGRFYSFGVLDAQLRRPWNPEADGGSFVLIAENSFWSFVHQSLPTTETSANNSKFLQSTYVTLYFQWFLYLVKLLWSPIFMAANIIYNPLSAVSLYVPRLDVTFERFRLRDAELVRQGAHFITRQYKMLNQDKDIDTGISGLIWDILAVIILGHGSDTD